MVALNVVSLGTGRVTAKMVAMVEEEAGAVVLAGVLVEETGLATSVISLVILHGTVLRNKLVIVKASEVAGEVEIEPATDVNSQVILHANVQMKVLRVVTVVVLEVAEEEEVEIEPATDVNSQVILHANVQMKVLRVVTVVVLEVAEVEEEEVLATTVMRLDILQEIVQKGVNGKRDHVTSVDRLDTLQEIVKLAAKINLGEEEEGTSLVTIVVVLVTFQENVHLNHQVVVVVERIAIAVDHPTTWPEIVQTKVMTKSSATTAKSWDTLQEIAPKKKWQLHDLIISSLWHNLI